MGKLGLEVESRGTYVVIRRTSYGACCTGCGVHRTQREMEAGICARKEDHVVRRRAPAISGDRWGSCSFMCVWVVCSGQEIQTDQERERNARTPLVLATLAENTHNSRTCKMASGQRGLFSMTSISTWSTVNMFGTGSWGRRALAWALGAGNVGCWFRWASCAGCLEARLELVSVCL